MYEQINIYVFLNDIEKILNTINKTILDIKLIIVAYSYMISAGKFKDGIKY